MLSDQDKLLVHKLAGNPEAEQCEYLADYMDVSETTQKVNFLPGRKWVRCRHCGYFQWGPPGGLDE